MRILKKMKKPKKMKMRTRNNAKRKIAAAVCLFMLSSCAEPPTEEEAAVTLQRLVEKSYELNEIYYGAGLPYEGAGEDPVSYLRYYYVTDDAPYQYDSALRRATLDVFTEDYAKGIFEVFLKGYSVDGEDAVYARYVENGDRIMVNAAYVPILEKIREYDFSTLEFLRRTSNLVVAEVQSTIDGKPDVTVRLTMRKVNIEDADTGSETGGDVGDGSAWRLDSPTY